MKRLLLTGIAALFLATGAAHAMQQSGVPLPRPRSNAPVLTYPVERYPPGNTWQPSDDALRTSREIDRNIRRMNRNPDLWVTPDRRRRPDEAPR